MKKTLTLFLSFCAFCVKAQLISFIPNDSTLTTQTVGYGGDVIEAVIIVQNPTSVAKAMKWKKSDYTIPGEWTGVQVCDPNHCWGNDAFTSSHSFVINANDTGLFKVDLNMNCTSGTGKIRLRTWETADSANTIQYVTFMYDLTAASNCIATGIADFKTDKLRFFPNPVKDIMKVEGLTDMKNVRADIYNVIGSKISSKAFDNDKLSDAEINVESIDKGIYFVKLYSNDKLVITKKFTKEN